MAIVLVLQPASHGWSLRKKGNVGSLLPGKNISQCHKPEIKIIYPGYSERLAKLIYSFTRLETSQ
jgi:hypothetical protein